MCKKYYKVVLGLLAHVTPLIFFSRIPRSEALVYNSFLFFRTTVLRKLFGIRFLYDKHCNFSRGWWLPKPWQSLFLLSLQCICLVCCSNLIIILLACKDFTYLQYCTCTRSGMTFLVVITFLLTYWLDWFYLKWIVFETLSRTMC